MALLTDRTLAQSTAITPTTLIHIVTTGDTSQNPAGSSYKAELSQLISVFSAGTDGSNSRRWTNLNTSLVPLSGEITIRSGAVVTLDPSLVTNMRISRYDNTTADMNSWFTALDNYTTSNPAKAYIQITDTLDNSLFGIYEVGNVGFFTSGGNDYWQIGTTYISGSASLFSTTNTLTVSWVLFGSDSPPFTGGSSNCITDFYVTNVYGCSPITIHSEVKSTGSTATGILSFAFGTGNTASGNYSHAEGSGNGALGNFSHSEGSGNQSIGTGSHSEGDSTNAIGNYSHSEGFGNVSSGISSHAEGRNTYSIGDYSHSEGFETSAITTCSHTQGWGTITGADFQLACGQYNIPTDTQSMFMVGNGSDDLNRSNLLTAGGLSVTINGDLLVTGNTTIEGTQIISTTGITASTFTITYDKTYWGVDYNGNVDLTLPNPTSNDGRNFFIKDEGGYSGTYRIRLTPSAGLIDGNTYVDMNINYMSLHLVARNNNWWII